MKERRKKISNAEKERIESAKCFVGVKSIEVFPVLSPPPFLLWRSVTGICYSLVHVLRLLKCIIKRNERKETLKSVEMVSFINPAISSFALCYRDLFFLLFSSSCSESFKI